MLVRFRDNENQGGLNGKFLTSREFSDLFISRNSQLKDIHMMQISIKSKTGCGVPIFVEYRAPLSLENPNAVIDYGVDAFPNDYQLLRAGDDHHYALKQCAIMAEYMQKTLGLELLTMRAEFSKDENGFIWLFFASNCQFRW